MKVTKEMLNEILYTRIGKHMLNEKDFEKYLNDIEADDPRVFDYQRIVHKFSYKFGGDIDEMITLLHTLKDGGFTTVEVEGNACSGSRKSCTSGWSVRRRQCRL